MLWPTVARELPGAPTPQSATPAAVPSGTGLITDVVAVVVPDPVVGSAPMHSP
ncbi:hypothetical protein GCM10018963_47810 [Saccharothrix longispora]